MAHVAGSSARAVTLRSGLAVNLFVPGYGHVVGHLVRYRSGSDVIPIAPPTSTSPGDWIWVSQEEAWKGVENARALR